MDLNTGEVFLPSAEGIWDGYSVKRQVRVCVCVCVYGTCDVGYCDGYGVASLEMINPVWILVWIWQYGEYDMRMLISPLHLPSSL
ncbi:hypothetical protein EON63_17785 [archaeon]|nr:MAG: hypothetical protein EON63_17785 [archaeon]